MGKNKRSIQKHGLQSQRWDNVPSTNASFEAYYKAQSIIGGEDPTEWDRFMHSLKTDLPTTFRVTGSKKSAHELNAVIRETYVPFLQAVEYGSEQIDPPSPIPWYPEGLAWQFKVTKQVIRKVQEFKRLQNFLVYESDAGNISRQEAVSMIPPLLLDVEPHHWVLDMCAAPGSKTAQLLEALHSGKAIAGVAENAVVIPQGLLIANDSDHKRTHLLVHQSLRRIPSPAMMVTNLDASQFPALKIATSMDSSGSKDSPLGRKALLFDRILCDVPCSGDGTMRKNVGIWRDWSLGNAYNLHALQLRILKRGISLLRPGGRLVYSTCSLNPIENEAVVSAALADHPEMRLVDVRGRLPELARRPGMLHWKVLDRDLSQELHTPADVAKGERKRRYPTTMWPDGGQVARHLERCLRIYPHLQDTGGFFVAVLEKHAETSLTALPSDGDLADEPTVLDASAASAAAPQPRSAAPCSTSLEPSSVVADTNLKRACSPPSPGTSVTKRQKAGNTSDMGSEWLLNEEGETPAVPEDCQPSLDTSARPYKEEPYSFLSPDEEQVTTCCSFFGLGQNFPKRNLLVRNAAGQALRSIYLTSDLVRNVLENNSYQRMRLVCCGVKLFARQENRDDSLPCKWRVVSDGTTFFRPFIGSSRLFRCSLSTLRQLMDVKEPYPRFEALQERSFQKAVRRAEPGSCVVDVEPGECDGAVLTHTIPVGVWISKTSVNLMMEKREKSALALRLWGKQMDAMD